ncbi:MAG: hypothetical protein DRQ55_12395 [Planctomycetota bacterium]|nr:MAG: hypothetical protein DRQ55_12395 [Planctomycetota bacterium]
MKPVNSPQQLIGARTLVVLLCLVGTELTLKHVGGFGWWTVNEQSERYGWRMLPSQDARGRDLTVVESINSEGFRDREWEAPQRGPDGAWQKDETLFRVAVLGNSMSFGTSVPIEGVYSRQLERLLQVELDSRGDDRRALVMNFAVQGYVFEQMARVYDDIAARWRPDLLVVPFHPHDIMPMRPSADDADYDFRTWVLRSATYDMLERHVIDRWLPPVPPKAAESVRSLGPTPDELPLRFRDWAALDLSITEQPFKRDNRRWWRLAGERMQGLLEQVEQDGGRLAIMALPRWRRHFRPKVMDADSFWAGWAWERRPRVLRVSPWPLFEQGMAPVLADLRATGMELGTTHDLTTLTWTDSAGRTHRGDELASAEQSLHLLGDMGHFTAHGHSALARALMDAVTDAELLGP